MKNCFNGMKRAAAVLLAALLAALLPVLAAADAWSPPDDLYNWQFESEEAAYNVSLFISNYVETGLSAYSDETSDAMLYRMLLKHFELNAAQYLEGVSVLSDGSGQRYLEISAEKFRQRAKALFPGRSLPADACPGADGDVIRVTADNANRTPLYAVTVDWINYSGDNVYTVTFNVYRSAGLSVAEIYGADRLLEDDAAVELVAEGNCRFRYSGSPTDDVKVFDLSMLSYAVEGVLPTDDPVFDKNRPYRPTASIGKEPGDPADETEGKQTETEADAEDDGASEQIRSAKTGETETAGTAGSSRGFLTSNVGIFILIVLAVLILAALAVLILLIVSRKR